MSEQKQKTVSQPANEFEVIDKREGWGSISSQSPRQDVGH